MRSLGFVIVLFAAACGGSSKPTTMENTAGGGGGSGGGTTADPCQHAADHLIDLMSAEAKGAPPEKVKHFKDSFISHCQTDKWSAAMQNCVIDAKAPSDLEKCDTLMTPEQKEALSKEGDEGPGGGEGGGAAPPPAPPPPPAQSMPKSRAPSSKGKKTGDPCEGGE